MSVPAAIAAARPGTQIHFLRGNYQGCFEFSKDEQRHLRRAGRALRRAQSEPVASASSMTCCSSGRQTCFNLEGADYVAVDGFELIGGRYGVRAVGAGYAASQHSRGIAVLNSNGHDQDRDPFFSGQADWAVWEGNVATARKRATATASTSATAATGTSSASTRPTRMSPATSRSTPIPPPPARRSASRSTTRAATPMPAPAKAARARATTSSSTRTTSTTARTARAELHERAPQRRPQQHFRLPEPGTTCRFWQETDNPRLGSSENRIVHNLFITTGRHAVQFVKPLHPQRVRQQRAAGRAGRAAAGDGKSVRDPDGGRRHGRRERLPRESLRLGQDRRAHADEQERGPWPISRRAGSPISHGAEPRSERLQADGGSALPRNGHALPARAHRPQWRRRAPARSTSGRSKCLETRDMARDRSPRTGILIDDLRTD